MDWLINIFRKGKVSVKLNSQATNDVLTVFNLRVINPKIYFYDYYDAIKFRSEIEDMLWRHNNFEVDFNNATITPQFIYHLLNPLINMYGLSLFEKIHFLNLSKTANNEIKNIY